MIFTHCPFCHSELKLWHNTINDEVFKASCDQHSPNFQIRYYDDGEISYFLLQFIPEDKSTKFEIFIWKSGSEIYTYGLSKHPFYDIYKGVIYLPISWFDWNWSLPEFKQQLNLILAYS